MTKRTLDETRAILRAAAGSSAPLATVSGVVTTKTRLVRYVDEQLPAVGVITTKSYQVQANSGNREPVICEVAPGCFGNSVGLRNPGMAVACRELAALRATYSMRALLNVSVSASSVADFVRLIQQFEAVADLIELNFSCPHAAAGYGAAIGSDGAVAASFVEQIIRQVGRTSALLFVKLTPNVEDIGAIARAVVAAGADGITAINTVGPVVHREEQTGQPILQNALGGKGGCSGRWIYEKALESISSIVAAVGPDVPLIGMGGVHTREEVEAFIERGSWVVGVGSAFGKVSQENWRAYTDLLVPGTGGVHGKQFSQLYKQTPSMAYQAYKITRIEPFEEKMSLLTLDGARACGAGQFAFVWLPSVGEKPFTLAQTDPVQFLIKERGEFTRALCRLQVGDTLFVRGVYGAEVEHEVTAHALLLAGGSGVAVLPLLAKQLQRQGTRMKMLVGTTEAEQTPLAQMLSVYGTVKTIPDEGKVGRVLDELDEALSGMPDCACYVVGPERFMQKAAQQLVQCGVPPERICVSMERQSMCGIGMCGECLCGVRLLCESGTFVDYGYLQREVSEWQFVQE